MSDTSERLIRLEGAVNFRDLGGYPVGGGYRTRWRVLFRADGLGDLTPTDFDVLRALDIRTVIDLRSGDELERGRFDVDAHPVTFHHFPIIEKLPDPDEFDRRPGLLGSQYQEMLRDAGGPIRSMAPARARSSRVIPPESCVESAGRTLFQRMSMSG